ncbi:MAG: hypothetical protein KJ558_14430 [Gammaproteobacteria bacterium]|nr:hypothetical protein [Gammaproteobacteria bacterium]MBU1655986.1 hypothetical protein [Gammaproteobacteria bacterium]MBU1962570.1 hypothetical protein [Gammaproteobacteria bacterium]
MIKAKTVLFWLLLALGLYPAFALINLALFGMGNELLPSLDAHPSKRFLLPYLLDDWLGSLPAGAALATLTVLIPRLLSRPFPAWLTVNLAILALCALLFAGHWGLYPAPLLLGNLFFLAGRPWKIREES